MNSSLPYVLPKKHAVEMLLDLTPQHLCVNKRERCTEHQGLNFCDYYCTVHSVSACLLCVNAAHPDCKIITMEEAADNSRKILREQADRLKREEELLKQVSVCLSVCMPTGLSVCLSAYRSVSLPLCIVLSVCPFVHCGMR